ncbi:hypothetical protein OUZ56_032542 [Daphnia magna]|uniref:Uncharacterized protein n=1 Tax=Daphnia magna TaxID=35525 RepID=A0ABR0B970_9CRUS|nr:hypothetical protein OUZ56_032542 [Daphnia magna]
MRAARFLIVFAVFAVGAVGGLAIGGCRSCVDSAPAPTVAGPETPAVLTPSTGTCSAGPRRCRTGRLRARRDRRRRSAGARAQGAAIEWGARKGCLCPPRRHIVGSCDRCIDRPGPRRGNVALLGKTAGYQIAPEAYVEPGCLEVWNLDRGTGVPLGAGGSDACLSVADRGLSFSTDGGVLAYVAYDPRETATTLPNGAGEAVTAWATWKKLPVVHLYEFANKHDTAFAVGERPVLAEDGASVLLQDSQGSPVRIDRATKVVTRLALPGETGFGVVAAFGDAILYQGFATAGAPRKTRPMSMGGTEDLHTVKAARVGTKQFATIADGVGIWSSVSFGRLK